MAARVKADQSCYRDGLPLFSDRVGVHTYELHHCSFTMQLKRSRSKNAGDYKFLDSFREKSLQLLSLSKMAVDQTQLGK